MINWMQAHWQLAVWAMAAVVVGPLALGLVFGVLGFTWEAVAALLPERAPKTTQEIIAEAKRYQKEEQERAAQEIEDKRRSELWKSMTWRQRFVWFFSSSSDS
jgi:hypothetical protein